MENADQKLVHILLVEDDINLGYLLVENLKMKGLEVTLAKTGREGMSAIGSQRFDMCILDIMIPDIDGLRLGAKLNKEYPDTPFIFLTARMQEADKLSGFETGADDYIIKPFSFKELYYRIMVVLKRRNIKTSSGQNDKKILTAGAVILNADDRILSVNGIERKLSQREANVLYQLMQHPGNYVSRSDILKNVWGNDDYFTAKSMDVYITRLRKLLKDDPTLEIENLYGSGYRIRQST